MKRRRTIDDAELLLVSMNVVQLKNELKSIAKIGNGIESDYILKIANNIGVIENFVNRTCGADKLIKKGEK